MNKNGHAEQPLLISCRTAENKVSIVYQTIDHFSQTKIFHST